MYFSRTKDDGDSSAGGKALPQVFTHASPVPAKD